MSFDKLLNTSDVVSLHVPLTPETRHLIDKRALTRMKRPAGARLDSATAREVAQREGATAIVTGDVAPLGSAYIVSVRLVSALDDLTGEIGHLLGLEAHANLGIMRAVWTATDLLNLAYGNLAFSPEQGAVIRSEVELRQQSAHAVTELQGQ